MNIYLLTQTVNNIYDTYDSCVVYAKDEEEAKTISPDECHIWHDGNWYFQYKNGKETLELTNYAWVDRIRDVTVKYLGTAEGKEKGLILASFNAG